MNHTGIGIMMKLKTKKMSKEIIDELKLIHSYFDVSKLDVYEHKHHIRLTSIIKDRIDFYVNKSKINQSKEDDSV